MTARYVSALRTAVLLSVGLAACTGPRALSDLPDRTVAGVYTAGADGQWFRPCASAPGGEAWWVTFTDRAAAQREAAPFADLLGRDGPVFVRWNAALGDRAEGAPAGPGPGTRYALVREILEVRPTAPGDCAAR